MGKEEAETIVGTIIRIEKGLLIPPEKKSSREIWVKSKVRKKNVFKADNLFSFLKYPLEVRLITQEKKIIIKHASTLKVKLRIKSDTAIAIAWPAIANHLRFISVLGFIQLSFKYICLLNKFIIPKTDTNPTMCT